MMIDLLNWGLKLGVVTTGLIGLVLLLRHPMIKYVGASAIYLLWSLPFLRLFMPNIHLPIKSDKDVLLFPDFYFPKNFDTAVPAVTDAVIAAEPAAEAGINLPAWPVIICGIWITVGVAWIILQLYRHRRYWQLLNHVSSPATKNVMYLCEKSRQIIGLRTAPHVKVAPKNIGPVVSGIIKPLIILPANFEKIYTEDEQLYALCHEMAHIKRYDVWAAFALMIFRAVHWYNPIVHYAARKFRIDQEAACDAFLLSRFETNNSYNYARLLLKAQQAATHPTKGQSLSLALSNGK